MTKIRAVRNIWGNWMCFEGAAQVEKFGEEYLAKVWLSDKLETGEYVLSSKSEIKIADIEAFRQKTK